MNNEWFTSEQLCPVERFPSDLRAHGTLVTIWAPIRSDPKAFPTIGASEPVACICVKLAVIVCGYIVCRIWQDRTRTGPSVRQRPPRFSNITEAEAWHDFRCRAEERKLLCPKPLRALRIPRRVVLRSGVPWGNCASPSPSHEEGVALLVARTCNEGVPAHKEFLRARQTPVPLICIVCWVLACTAPGTR